MKKGLLTTAATFALIAGAAGFAVQDNKKQEQTKPNEIPQMPEMPAPVEQHQWLKKFVGEWTTEFQLTSPDGQSMKESGTESVRAVGDFWITSDMRSTFLGDPYAAVLTLGYDPKKEKYIGTYVDSMTSLLWTYEGTLDEDKKKLTLMTEGEMPGGEKVKFRESHEFKSDDHRIFTSEMIGPDGEFMEMLTVHAHRKK